MCSSKNNNGKQFQVTDGNQFFHWNPRILSIFQLLIITFLIKISSAGADKSITGALSDLETSSVGAESAVSPSPCADYYEFVCSSWLTANPRPADTAEWNKIAMVQRKNDALVETLIKQNNTSPLGVYYQSCMDTLTIERLGMQPLYSYLDLLPLQFDSLAHYFTVAGKLKNLMGIDLLLDFSVIATSIETSIINIQQPKRKKILLLDPWKYDNDDSAHDTFVKWSSNVFQTLLGDSSEKASANSELLWQFESLLAKVWDNDEPSASNAIVEESIASVSEYYGVPLDAFFSPDGANVSTAINLSPIAIPADQLIGGLSRLSLTKSLSLEGLLQHTRLHMLTYAAKYLSLHIQTLHHDLDSKYRLGVHDMSIRESECDCIASKWIGADLGKLFYDATFDSNKMTLATGMVNSIHSSFQDLISHLHWSDNSSMSAFLDKNSKMKNYIGLPPVFNDYSSAELFKSSFFNNTMSLYQVDVRQMWRELSEPSFLYRWDDSPTEVGAFYNAEYNSLNLPIGILQPGYFDTDLPMSSLWGSIGSVIGHELIHGFDSNGMLHDPSGKRKDWISSETISKYEEFAQCVIEEYNQFTWNDKGLNGRKTLEENIADIGGLNLAYRSYQDWLSSNGETASIPQMDPQPTNNDQLFFTSFAQNWCENGTQQATLNRIRSDEHSLGFARVNGALRNFTPFAAAYHCPVGSPMNPPQERKCRVFTNL